jgi:hypothetical protein
MMKHATGTFKVKMTPQPADENVGAASIGRMALDKQFTGDLVASSKGQMLAIRTVVDGSAGYVAMECLTGTLHGLSGSFALQHSGTMTRGLPQLSVTVVPDSGTDQLTGIVGKLSISIVDGSHLYDFEYSLPSA